MDWAHKTLVAATATVLPEQGVLRGERRPDLLRDEVLSDIFTATARERAAHPAMICGERTLSYADVDAASDAIARGLERRGVGPGDVVGLWMSRGVDLLVAQIGIAKSGAAWLPFDADAPVERIATCLADASAKAVLTSDAFAPRAEAHGLVALTAALLCDPADSSAVDPRGRGLTPDHPAYLIYTSGSTGTPKGIVVTHRNICHYLRAGNALYGLGPDDVMFQSASVAFDLSMEEIWIPYLVGATLFVATPEMMAETDTLADVLTSAGVTAIDTVPTLLSILSQDVPTLRLILLGGEALPASVVQRWAREGRRIFNTYGPTEATVVATACEARPGETVSIGGPIPNYSCYVVAESMTLLPPGVQGELLIGGPGVARGYLQRPELTEEKFIANPFASDGLDPVLYRSGDAVSLDEQGRILFHGRIDDQVKIRGFRVELGEIEAKLDELPGVAQAAVVLRNDDGLDRLIAFIVAEPGTDVDRMQIRVALAERLPSYMVPSRFEMLDSLPRLISGKIDRKALRAAPLSSGQERSDEQEAARTPTEAALLAAAQRVFPGQTLPFDADFFTDLGGHSLIAARFVSAVRETPALSGMMLQDIYGARTLRGMAALIDGRAPAGPHVPRDLGFAPPPFMRRFLCGAAQAVAMPFILGLVTLQWLGLFLASVYLLQDDAGVLGEIPVLLGIYVLLNLGTKLLVVALKWAIIGRTKPGRYPLWGAYYFRVWLVERLIQVTTIKFLQNSPLMRVYLRMLGAKVGRDAMVSDFEAGAIDLVTIGDRASLGLRTRFANRVVIGNEMIIGTIAIGDDVTTGTSCSLGPDTVLEEGAELGDLTALPAGTTVPRFERWVGSPAKKVEDIDPATLDAFPTVSPVTRALQNATYAASYVVMLMLGLLPIFPAFYLLYNMDALLDGQLDYIVAWSTLPWLAWPTAMVLILVSIVVIVAIRWTVLPTRVQPGRYSIHSWFYVRKWVVGLATEVTLETLSGLYATVFMRGWYRMLGTRVGKGTEISTNLSGRYDLVELGAQNFVGDETVLGDEEIRRGWMILEKLKTGDRVFMGNSSVVPPGSLLEDGSLVGVKSTIPNDLRLRAGEISFGSPAMILPARQKVEASSQWTYDPPKWMLWVRTVFEALHTSLPTATFITAGYMTADIIEAPLTEGSYWTALAIFLSAGVVIALALVVVSVAAKWLLIGKYKPIMKPMWSFWAMRTEAVAVLYGGLVGKASIEFLRGTPFLPWILRLYGTKIGKGVWMDLTDLTEFDCVEIGDFCTLNMGACLQTHLYEDRVMKVGRVHVERGVHVGWDTTVLYDTHVGEFAQLDQLTVVMKGEFIPAHTRWAGAPAVPQGDAPARVEAAASVLIAA
ncbi:amino acid adenylation domain-containing protein [Alsobacter sp. SYSU M60028]|uniref:Amino acid adenylation domain-containing protein n=1 Tax=Alsobacter ponti TaxID=2962936 RepID=A0ABT1LDV1_9HYPH|nr:Pls/PosA family non-ribosomal peptide synthetase [Alsobacter ponti]MCP8939068.1 amino acid adenylation domain-containing protein [Alsobacter ponti]